jgi:hypothetical protein
VPSRTGEVSLDSFVPGALMRATYPL